MIRLVGIGLLGVGLGRLGVGDVGDICKGRPSGNPGIGIGLLGVGLGRLGVGISGAAGVIAGCSAGAAFGEGEAADDAAWDGFVLAVLGWCAPPACR
jgi:hypothetical protein